MRKLFFTLYDIGFLRIYQRFIYEFKKRLNKYLPKYILIKIYNLSKKTPYFLKKLDYLKRSSSKSRNIFLKIIPTSLEFNFINQRKILNVPFTWQSSEWDRLWQFNLHYFDWVKIELDNYLKNKNCSENTFFFDYIIDYWIDSNPIGKGDGWDSYTLSLRIRNWIWLFRIFPEYLTKKRIDSLWIQICWLKNNPEVCHGGNHWLENLITLIIGSLQFEGHSSKVIYDYSIKELKKELSYQILRDGGHEERSSSYHLLILDRLVELGCVLQNIRNERPIWLIDSIRSMTLWVKKVTIFNKRLPQFNDCFLDIFDDLDEIIHFSDSYLDSVNYLKNGFRANLLNQYENMQTHKKYYENRVFFKSIEDLEYTGWTCIRPNKEWELFFKSGNPCPKHLGAHAHSDLLSFELYKNGKPIFISAGTSVYKNCPQRHFERSGQAHNIMQLGLAKKSGYTLNINWIEGVDVWHSFRAGKKSKVIDRSFGQTREGVLWVEGVYDTYKSINATHKRRIEINIDQNQNLIFVIKDFIKCKYIINWQNWLHLGQGIPDKIIYDAILSLGNKYDFIVNWYDTDYAISAGKKIKRRSCSQRGILTKGSHELVFRIML